MVKRDVFLHTLFFVVKISFLLLQGFKGFLKNIFKKVLTTFLLYSIFMVQGGNTQPHFNKKGGKQMRKKADLHVSMQHETLDKLNELKELMKIERSTLIETILIKGMEDIRKLNYNFIEFMNK